MPLDTLKIRRLMNGQSVTSLAPRAGMTRPALSRLLAGRINPSLTTLERLAAALGVKARDLLR